MVNETYVCAEPVGNYCNSWVVQNNIMDTLAITPEQAVTIGAAMGAVLILGWSIGEIGRMIKNANNPFA